MKKRAVKRNLAGLFLVIFLDLLGVGIIIPVLAPLFYSVNNTLIPEYWDTNTINLAYGLMIGIYPIMQFFGAPILGSLADRFGRKKLLTTSLLGTLLGYLITGWGIGNGKLWMIFAGRALDGFTGGNIAVANSAIADMSSEKDRASNFGLVGAAFGLGFIIGPFLGGLLSNPDIFPYFSPQLPFWTTAALTSLNILVISFAFKETLKENIFQKLDIFTGFKNLHKAIQMRTLRSVFFVVFLHQLGFAFFTQFFPVFLVQKFQFSEFQIGMLFAYTGVWITFGHGVLTRIVARFAGPVKALKRSILILSLSMGSLLLPKTPWLFFIIKPFIALSEGITFPNVTAVISNRTPSNQQGEIMGIITSIRAAGMAIPPLSAAILISINQNGAIITSTALLFLAWLIFILTFRKD